MTKKTKQHAPQGDCPQRYKMSFHIKKAAKRAARARPGMGIYKCECGRYHLYTKRKQDNGR